MALSLPTSRSHEQYAPESTTIMAANLSDPKIDFPNEVWTLVFEDLFASGDLQINCRLVCKHLNEIATRILYKSFTLKMSTATLPLKFPRAISNQLMLRFSRPAIILQSFEPQFPQALGLFPRPVSNRRDILLSLDQNFVVAGYRTMYISIFDVEHIVEIYHDYDCGEVREYLWDLRQRAENIVRYTKNLIVCDQFIPMLGSAPDSLWLRLADITFVESGPCLDLLSTTKIRHQMEIKFKVLKEENKRSSPKSLFLRSRDIVRELTASDSTSVLVEYDPRADAGGEEIEFYKLMIYGENHHMQHILMQNWYLERYIKALDATNTNAWPLIETLPPRFFAPMVSLKIDQYIDGQQHATMINRGPLEQISRALINLETVHLPITSFSTLIDLFGHQKKTLTEIGLRHCDRMRRTMRSTDGSKIKNITSAINKISVNFKQLQTIHMDSVSSAWTSLKFDSDLNDLVGAFSLCRALKHINLEGCVYDLAHPHHAVVSLEGFLRHFVQRLCARKRGEAMCSVKMSYFLQRQAGPKNVPQRVKKMEHLWEGKWAGPIPVLKTSSEAFSVLDTFVN